MKKVKVYKADGTPIEVYDFEVKELKKHGVTERKKEKKPTGYTKERKQSKTTK